MLGLLQPASQRVIIPFSVRSSRLQVSTSLYSLSTRQTRFGGILIPPYLRLQVLKSPSKIYSAPSSYSINLANASEAPSIPSLYFGWLQTLYIYRGVSLISIRIEYTNRVKNTSFYLSLGIRQEIKVTTLGLSFLSITVSNTSSKQFLASYRL